MDKKTKAVLYFFAGNALKNAYGLGTRQFFSLSFKNPYPGKIRFIPFEDADDIQANGSTRLKSFFEMIDYKGDISGILHKAGEFPEGSAVVLCLKESEKEKTILLLSEEGFRICELFCATKVAESFYKTDISEENRYYCLAVRK